MVQNNKKYRGQRVYQMDIIRIQTSSGILHQEQSTNPSFGYYSARNLSTVELWLLLFEFGLGFLFWFFGFQLNFMLEATSW